MNLPPPLELSTPAPSVRCEYDFKGEDDDTIVAVFKLSTANSIGVISAPASSYWWARCCSPSPLACRPKLHAVRPPTRAPLLAWGPLRWSLTVTPWLCLQDHGSLDLPRVDSSGGAGHPDGYRRYGAGQASRREWTSAAVAPHLARGARWRWHERAHPMVQSCQRQLRAWCVSPPSEVGAVGGRGGCLPPF